MHEDKYLARAKCETLSNCIMALLDDTFPDDVYAAAVHLSGMCDKYVAKGYSVYCKTDEKGEIDWVFTSPNMHD